MKVKCVQVVMQEVGSGGGQVRSLFGTHNEMGCDFHSRFWLCGGFNVVI